MESSNQVDPVWETTDGYELWKNSRAVCEKILRTVARYKEEAPNPKYQKQVYHKLYSGLQKISDAVDRVAASVGSKSGEAEVREFFESKPRVLTPKQQAARNSRNFQ
jgi:hypothetical protein